MGTYDDDMRRAMQTISGAGETKLAILEDVLRERRDELEYEKLVKLCHGTPVRWQEGDGAASFRYGVVRGRNKRTLVVAPDDDEDETVNIAPDDLEKWDRTESDEKAEDAEGEQDDTQEE